jgi:hypothetical protein
LVSDGSLLRCTSYGVRGGTLELNHRRLAPPRPRTAFANSSSALALLQSQVAFNPFTNSFRLVTAPYRFANALFHILSQINDALLERLPIIA